MAEMHFIPTKLRLGILAFVHRRIWARCYFPTPFPVKDIFCVPLRPLSVMTTPPSANPSLVGVKVIWILQLNDGARRLPQLLVWANSPLLVMLWMFRSFSPMFANGMFTGALVVFKSWFPKL